MQALPRGGEGVVGLNHSPPRGPLKLHLAALRVTWFALGSPPEGPL